MNLFWDIILQLHLQLSMFIFGAVHLIIDHFICRSDLFLPWRHSAFLVVLHWTNPLLLSGTVLASPCVLSVTVQTVPTDGNLHRRVRGPVFCQESYSSDTLSFKFLIFSFSLDSFHLLLSLLHFIFKEEILEVLSLVFKTYGKLPVILYYLHRIFVYSTSII